MKIFLAVVIFSITNLTLFGQTFTIDDEGNEATCSGNFYDSGGSGGDYSNGEGYTMTFCSNNSSCISVAFNSFDLDTSDYLYIYDGPNTGSTLLATLTGNTLPASYSSFFGCLTFQFVSNDTITSAGWAASFSCGACTFNGGGSGALTTIYDNTACGLNYTQASAKVTTRYATPAGTGLPTTLNITGLPPANTCWTVENAYIWWTESSQNNNPVTLTMTNPAATTTTYNVSPVGTGVAKCWSEQNTKNYRIDVTGMITTNGNYTVNISSGVWPVDGVTLLIVYRDLLAPYEGRLIINDGLLANSGGGSSLVTISGINACAASVSAEAFLMVGDMQDNIGGGVHNTTLNGVTAQYPNNFWNFNTTPTTVTAGQATAQFGVAPIGGDCYSLVAVGLYYQTTTCSTCPVSAYAVPIVQTATTCNGGSITANPGGGAAPYSYSWNNGGSTQSLAGLFPGLYSVTVTDGLGCTSSNSITVTAAPPLSYDTTITNIACNGVNNGQIVVSPLGGTAPYTYSWDTGATSSTISSLSQGSYSLTMSDDAGCVSTGTFNIIEPAALGTSFNTTDITCFGLTDGTSLVTVTGGAPTYSYSWSNGATTDAISSLSAGSYTVDITDINGCTTSASTSVVEPPSMVLILNSSDVLCNGEASGWAASANSGGTIPYTYLWNTGATIDSIAGLPIGTYVLTVTDDQGCTVVDSTVIGEPTALTIVLDSTDVLCNGDNTGAVNSTVTGGTPTYSYLWSSGQTVASISNISVGQYYVDVTDGNGCIISDTITITEPTPLIVTINIDSTCVGICEGGATAVANGGAPSYQYAWSNGEVGDSAVALCEGANVLVVTDSNNCVLTTNFTTPTFVELTPFFEANPPEGNDPLTVSFTDLTSGNVIFWNWDFGTGDSDTTQNPSYEYTSTGFYPVTLTVTDTNGCIFTYEFNDIIVNPMDSIIIGNIFTPNGDGSNDVFGIFSESITSLKGQIFNRWGQLVYEWNTPKGGWNGRTTAGKEASEGTYYFLIELTTFFGEDKKYQGHFTLKR